jgi:hypothetical protein
MQVISPAFMKAIAPLAGQRTECCSKDSGAFSFVPHTGHVEAGPTYLWPRTGAPVTIRIVMRAASADILLAWAMSTNKIETMPWP